MIEHLHNAPLLAQRDEEVVMIVVVLIFALISAAIAGPPTSEECEDRLHVEGVRTRGTSGTLSACQI